MPTLEPPDPATYLARPTGSTGFVLVGPQTRARYFPDGPGPGCTKMRLSPGALGRSVRGLADRDVPLDALEPAVTRHAGLAGKATVLLAEGRRVSEVAAALNLSERHLRTVFADATGLSPTQFTRIRRVRFVLEHLDRPLGELAAHAGYYDQAHLTTEFRRVMGVPPGAFAAGHRPAAEPCRGAGR